LKVKIMPSTEWSAKRKRQYQHIKDSVLARGQSESLAEEIAARTVNKERAQHGESVEASASSINDMPAGRRGGLRSHQGAGGRTVAQLRNEARQRNIVGRSSMNKTQLEQALAD
jgi:plasmid stabilization system protein ParE